MAALSTFFEYFFFFPASVSRAETVDEKRRSGARQSECVRSDRAPKLRSFHRGRAKKNKSTEKAVKGPRGAFSSEVLQSLHRADHGFARCA